MIAGYPDLNVERTSARELARGRKKEKRAALVEQAGSALYTGLRG